MDRRASTTSKHADSTAPPAPAEALSTAMVVCGRAPPDVLPRFGSGIVGGLDDPEVDAVVPGRPAPAHGDRGSVLLGGVPQRRQQPAAAGRRSGAVVGGRVDPPELTDPPVAHDLVGAGSVEPRDALGHLVQSYA